MLCLVFVFIKFKEYDNLLKESFTKGDMYESFVYYHQKTFINLQKLAHFGFGNRKG